MITDALLAVAWLFMELFIALLPSSPGLPTEFETGLQSLFDSAWGLNGILPVDSLLAVLGALFAFELAVYTYKFVRWLLASLPFSPIKH